jgi:Tol biopolymer transport system component
MRGAGTVAAAVAASAAIVFGVLQVGAQMNQTSSLNQTGPPPAERTVHDRVKWCPMGRSPDCVDLSGWIVYQHNGIWALDPSRPDDPDHKIQLTNQREVDPLEWSSDGTKLLVRSWGQGGHLSVLHADGTETLIAEGGFFDGSFSPDGSRVIYTPYAGGGMGIVDSEGGTPRRLLDPTPGDGVYELAYSPDGEQIAYFTGGGDHSHTLRVMSSDGTDGRTLLFHPEASHINDLDWSPDGQRLMFSFAQGEGGIWIVGVDGSDPTQVVPSGVNPAWSPDGTRISYEVGTLRIADADGTHVTEFGYGGSGAWNPLPLDR